MIALFHKLSRSGPETLAEKTLFFVLGGCGLVYGSLVWLREQGFRQGFFSSFQAPVPTLSVGNLTVGGTGKTPIVDHIGRLLTGAGIKTAVVSRGFGRDTIEVDRVVSTGHGPEIPPELAGDEPFLLARRNPELVVLVGRRRRHAVEKAVREFGAKAVILDDGFQHLGVRRHLDIVLLDARRPLGNGRVLPGGPLREFPSALKRGNLFIFTRCERDAPSFPVLAPALFCRHLLHPMVRSLEGDRVPLATLKSLRGGVFAGIGEPTRFFEDLRCQGLGLEKFLSFPDHVRFGGREIEAIGRMGEGLDYLITTEKDGVKLRSGDLKLPCYQVSLEIEFADETALKKHLSQLFPAKELL